MKAKKICALLLASALAVGTVSALAACKNDDENKDKFVEDTRLWYAVGRNTKGTLSKFDNFYPQDTSVAFTRDTEVKDENVFTLSLDIYADPAGYGFKFLYKTSAEEVISDNDLWTRQIGINNFAGVEGEGEEAVIKNEAGETVFTTKGGMDANNLYLAKGQEGTYKFTLKTTSDTDNDPVITWEKTEDIEVTHDMYVRGDINNFGVNPIPMNEVISGEVITWTAQIEVTAKDLWRNADGSLAEGEENGRPVAAGQLAALQLYNDIDKKTYATITSEEVELPVVKVESFDGDEYDCVLVPEGKYTITYHQADNKITYQAGTHEMYFIGGLNNWDTSKAVTDEYKLTEKDGTWTGALYLEAGAELKLYNGLKLGDDSAWCGVSGEANENGVYEAGGSNIVIAESGLYYFTFDTEDGTITVEKLDIYVVGTFMDGTEKVNFSIKEGVTPKMTLADGVYTVTVTVTDVSASYDWMGAGKVFGLKAMAQASDNTQLWFNPVDEQNEGNNILLTETGTYTVSITLETNGSGKVSAEKAS